MAPRARANQSYTWAQVKSVQSLIERCLNQYMTQAEIIATLQVQADAEPALTCLAWSKLEEQNPDFFLSYDIQLRLKDQIARPREVAYRKRFGLRKTPEEFQPARAPKIADDDGARLKLLPLARLDGSGGPGASLEFGLAVAEVDGRNRVPVGVLLDDESMALLAYLGSRPSCRSALAGSAQGRRPSSRSSSRRAAT
ncbi:hypothetical protein SO694_00131063 [Aureococcus anophagefferens]|uniref:Uncharacterized protein n=1 Tax=Aureococcus anophagefferens TaxID=44056 RepID=A0ABR1GG38_AURAN